MISRREFLRYSSVAGAAAFAAFALPACAPARQEQKASDESGNSEEQSSGASTENTAPTASSIVIYFSHTGENYKVGTITEGNTAIVAGYVAELTGSDQFEIVPTDAYPEGYDDCCDVALEEQDRQARPEYEGDVDITPYETVYLGYPIWWSDLPMCVYTFLENHDWNGKTIHPFCTHAGSGLSGTVAAIKSTCEGATVEDGLAITGVTAQESRDEARASVEKWLG